jgi:hypothetical protein
MSSTMICRILTLGFVSKTIKKYSKNNGIFNKRFITVERRRRLFYRRRSAGRLLFAVR